MAKRERRNLPHIHYRDGLWHVVGPFFKHTEQPAQHRALYSLLIQAQAQAEAWNNEQSNGN